MCLASVIETLFSLAAEIILLILFFTETRLSVQVAEAPKEITISCLPNHIELTRYSLPSAVRLYSIEVNVFVGVEGEEGGRCALIWLGRNCTPILVSNFVNRYEL